MKVKHAVLALYQLAVTNDCLETVLQSFETMHTLLTDVLISYLDAPSVDIKDKLEALETLPVDSYTKGFVATLIKRRNVYLFDDMYQGMLTHIRELNKVYLIDVYVYHPLSDSQKTLLEKQLIHYFQASKVILNTHLDQTVIGGLKIMYQKQSLDHTVIQQFHQMEMMI
jgi:F-type H+-transporting ATPase subunit delta